VEEMIFDEKKMLEEFAFGLRNADIFSTSHRNVTTTTQVGVINGTSITIAVFNVKNVRSVTIDGLPYVYGKDYDVEVDHASGCVLTFSSSQSGNYEVEYDYGSDVIFPDYARNDLSISSGFPRIGMGFLTNNTVPGGFGNVNQNTHTLSIVVYAKSPDLVMSIRRAVRTWVVHNQNGLYYSRLIKPLLSGPVMVADFVKFKDKMFQGNLDVISNFNLEVTN